MAARRRHGAAARILVIGARWRSLKRLPAALVVLLAWNSADALAGSLPSASTEKTMLQKRFCAGPDAAGSAALCARLMATGRYGPVLPAGRRLTYASRRPAEGLTSRIESFGMSVSEITGDLATRYRVTQSIEGVVVTDVVSGGVADRAGLGIGDVLLELDQDVIENPDSLARRVEALEESDAETALILLYRNYQHRFLLITID